MTDRLPVATIKGMLAQRLPSLLGTIAPGMKRKGNHWQGPNPTRTKDSGTSFTVWHNGAWKEFDQGEDEKGDVIDLIAYCRRCDKGDAIRWAKDWLGIGSLSPQERATLDRLAAAKAQRQKQAALDEAERKRKRAFAIVLDARPIREGSPVDRYLKHWGIDVGEIANFAGDVKEAATLDYFGPRPDGDPGFRYHGPALVAAIRQANGAISTVQALFVREDSAKLMALPAAARPVLGPKKHGAVWISNGPTGLDPLAAARRFAETGEREDLMATEGVKTGLAGAWALPEIRVWSLLDLGNIAELPFLPWVNRLVVALENDLKPAAIEGREKVLAALEAKGFDVVPYMRPAAWGSDLADTLNLTDTLNQ